MRRFARGHAHRTRSNMSARRSRRPGRRGLGKYPELACTCPFHRRSCGTCCRGRGKTGSPRSQALRSLRTGLLHRSRHRPVARRLAGRGMRRRGLRTLRIVAPSTCSRKSVRRSRRRDCSSCRIRSEPRCTRRAGPPHRSFLRGSRRFLSRTDPRRARRRLAERLRRLPRPQGSLHRFAQRRWLEFRRRRQGVSMHLARFHTRPR